MVEEDCGTIHFDAFFSFASACEILTNLYNVT
jgi:hypothetical protein